MAQPKMEPGAVPLLERSPHEVVSQMLRGHNGMDATGVSCRGCGEKLAEPTGSWLDAARALARHQWAVMGINPDALLGNTPRAAARD